MSKILPVSDLPRKSNSLSSIERLQADSLRFEYFSVLCQENLRCLSSDILPVLDVLPLVPQSSLDFQAPRPCNTGALSPSDLQSEVKVDWLEFSIKGVSPSRMCSILGVDFALFASAEYGMQGYPDMAEYGKVKLLWSDLKPLRGCKVILSSVALDEVGVDAIDLIKTAVLLDASFARIDLALDDTSGAVTIDTVIDSVNAFEDVNRFTQVEVRQPVDRRTQGSAGRSVYWGKPSSSRQVVFYDKEIEQFRKTGEETGPWLRCEVRWKKRAAKLAAWQLANFGMKQIIPLICGVIDFRTNDNVKTERRTICDWWHQWTGDVFPVKTGVCKVVKTIEEKAAWLGRQMSKTIGQVAALLDGETILEMIRAGIHATTEREWKILDPEGKRVVFSGSGEFEYVMPF